jgi:YVTN family beta-propeller protein
MTLFRRGFLLLATGLQYKKEKKMLCRSKQKNGMKNTLQTGGIGGLRWLRRFWLVSLIGALGLLGLGTVPVQAAPFAYIANWGSNTVSILDTITNTVTATNTVIATVPVGGEPGSLGQFIGPDLAVTFAPTISRAGTGSGTVTSSPAGISCGTDCTESYSNGTMVTLTATADPGSTFAGWSGDSDCSDGQVTLTANKTCTATFNTQSPAIPTALTLTVRETTGITRSGEVVRSGVPLPRSLNLLNTNMLTLVDTTGIPVPAEFQVLARWDAGRDDTSAPIQWLLVTFPASVAANGSTTYSLVTDGSAGPNPLPTTPVSVTQNGNQITVNTGAATFTLGGNSDALFDKIRLADGTRLVSGSTLTARVNSMDVGHPTTRNIYIEYAGPLTAIVVVEGEYNMPPVGGGGLGSRRRYVFTAGSPTALVRHIVNWEGDLCGLDVWECNGSPNGVRVQQVRDALTLDLAAPLSVMAVGDFEAPAVQGDVTANQETWVRQQLRANRTAPLAFDVSVPSTTGATGAKADGGMLAVSGAPGAVAVALNHMHRYEPQALRLLADGRLVVDVADDQAWLGNRQGLFATLAVSALPTNPSRTDLDRLLWAPLNRPLRAWPEPGWFTASAAVDEIPEGPLSADLADYDTHVASVLSNTLQKVDEKGLAGLVTFGVYPRYWSTANLSDELDCSGDPTDPGETWDNLYWCATWTDYHNTVATAPIWAMRSGEVEWLDEIGFPGALRMLHTQIIQCAPDDTSFWCGGAPAGYGGYRGNFNSSHQYWDNLFLYYWLTGDYTVVETVKRGAESVRNYLCTRRPAAPCLPGDPPTDEYAGLTGRFASQWFAAFRFVGLASDDASYLEDYKSGLARAVTQYYVEPEQAGTRYGFWLFAPVNGPGTYTTDQLWMASLYDMNMLYRLQRDTDDAPIGNPAIPPSQVLAAWARTLVDFGATVSPDGDGTAGGTWPNNMDFTWSGARIGGTLGTVSATPADYDENLYDTGKACLTAVLVRAGQQTGDSALTQMGADLTHLALDAAQADGSPLGKLQGEYLSRLHAAVARLAAASPPDALNQTFRLSVSVIGSGTVTSSLAGINCPGDCVEDYASGTLVTLAAAPARRWRFASWAGACSGTGSCVVSMTADQSVTATFTR